MRPLSTTLIANLLMNNGQPFFQRLRILSTVGHFFQKVTKRIQLYLGNNLLYPYRQAFTVQPPNDEKINPQDMLKDAEKQVAKFWVIWMRHIPPHLLLPNNWFRSRDNPKVGDFVIN